MPEDWKKALCPLFKGGDRLDVIDEFLSNVVMG